MGKYDGILICSDLDGTLSAHYDDGKIISDKNCEAIKTFQSEGGIFTFATGRMPEYLREIIFPYVVPNAPAVTINGSMIFSFEENRYLKKVYLRDEVKKLPVEVAENYSHLVVNMDIVGEDKTFNVDISGKESVPELEKTLSLREKWCKFVFRGVDEKATLEFQEILNSGKYKNLCNFPRSWPTGQEVLDINATKGNRVLDIKNILGNIHTVICVGDFENDISMIKIADKGYAVENAVESVKRAADFVTVSNYDNAIAKIISEI